MAEKAVARVSGVGKEWMCVRISTVLGMERAALVGGTLPICAYGLWDEKSVGLD